MPSSEYHYIRKTARYNGKKYEATGKTEQEAMTKLAEKLAAAKRGEETIGGSMTVDAWYKQWKSTYRDIKIEKGDDDYALLLQLRLGLGRQPKGVR